MAYGVYRDAAQEVSGRNLGALWVFFSRGFYIFHSKIFHINPINYLIINRSLSAGIA